MSKNTPVSAAFVLRHPAHFLAFGLGSGLSPRAPGTAGTLAAVPFYILMSHLPLHFYLLMLVVTFGLGIWLCEVTSRNLGVHDHGGIVWDEFVGYWLTMVAAPAGWVWIVAGFALFRVFDILKPFPIGYFDRHVHGGLGIMLDDAIAATFAWLCLQLIALGLS